MRQTRGDQKGLQLVCTTLLFQLQNPEVEGFIAWMSRLTVADHGDIPDDWFEEFWQDTLKCRLENATGKCCLT